MGLVYSVFLVDDEPLIIKNIIDSVPWQENGFEVFGWSTSSEDAIEKIADIRPDLVISDLKMPRIDGIEMIRTLREKGVDAEFVMLSAYGEFEASRNFFLLNGFDYLLKPIQIPEVELVLEKISRKLGKSRERISEVVPIAKSSTFDALVSYVSENYTKKHTLQDLSTRFNLSATYICNLFTRHYGVSLTSFLTSLRMNEAAKMTKETTVAFKEIAISCGYSDYFYFCKVFKNHFGMPPSEYRQGD